jgi:hypothetical protein
MKKLFCSVALMLSAYFAFSQIMTADEVKTVFSPKNLESNRVEYTMSTLIEPIGFGLASLQSSISQVEITTDTTQIICTYNTKNQLSRIFSGRDTLCKFFYNRKSQLEIAHFGNHVYAITYDKKGRVVSEAKLYQLPNDATTGNTALMSKDIVMSGDFAYSDQWKRQSLNDSLPKIYMYEIYDGSKVRTWAIDIMYVYDYNGKGQVTKKMITATNKARNAVYEFKYKDGKLQQQDKSYTNNNMVEGSTYFYENGALVKVNKGYFKSAKKNPELISSETNTMKYDSQGNLIEFTSQDGYRYDFCEMQYDENNRIVKIQKKQENGQPTPLFQCNYDTHNNVIKSVNGHSLFQCSYDYDAHGNWTKQTIVLNGKNKTVVRNITYRQ